MGTNRNAINSGPAFVLVWQTNSQSILANVFFILLVAGVSGSLFAQQLAPSSTDMVDYSRDVAPIFEKHCNQCHGAAKQTSDLRLDLRSAILKGGGSGSVIQVGNSATSRLVDIVTGRDSDFTMPPEGDGLSEREIEMLRAWIDQGALGPDDSADLDRKLPWSFEPVVRPVTNPAFNPASNISPSDTSDLIHGEVDFLLTRRLAEHGLTFSPQAERRTLIRRLYLVALGVPPSLSDIQQYIDDPRPDAFGRLVDRVLADERYGERMARHWLDVVRFAESNGFETNRVRYNAWPYRDYVIQAFNNDTPYDQFITEQIVGDAVGVDAGTGFLAAGSYDLVKSPDVNLTLMQRQDELADLVNTTGTAFLGLTLGCARCHDHKFDPVTQVDFYSLQAVLAGVHFGERPLPRERSAESLARIQQIEREIASHDQATKQLLSLAKKNSSTAVDIDKLLPEVNSKLNEEAFSPILASAVRLTILASGDSQPCIDEWEVFNSSGDNVALASVGAKASASSELPGHAIHKISHLNDGKPGNEFSWISNEVNTGFARIDFAQPELISRMTWGRDRLGMFNDRLARQYVIEALREGQWIEIASSRNRQPSDSDDTQLLVAQLSKDDQTAYNNAAQAKKSLQAELSQLTAGPTAWLGTFTQPEPVYRLYRGDPLMKREQVAPAMVQSLGGEPLPEDLPERERRQALAKWLTAPSNPLTARVMVNRLWHYTFGTGIVDTPSDFGMNGSPPFHPELLDWLADEFVASGWSIKHIHKLLLISHAFQQSSHPTADGLAVDADSRMLWRFPPRRLEAEAIRDSMLVSSGEMNWQMGGPGFFLQRVEQDNVYRYFPKEECGPDESRRMVYLTRIRGEQDPVFGSFDCPNGNQVMPKRSRSNTPLQALNLYNSRFVEQQSELLARRLERESIPDGNSQFASGNSRFADIDRQVQLAFELLVARKPDTFELETSRELVASQGLVAFCRAMLNTTEFLFVF